MDSVYGSCRYAISCLASGAGSVVNRVTTMKKSKASKSSAVTQPKSSNPTKGYEYVTTRVNLPPDLLAWAEQHAYDQMENLSDLVRNCLEYEQFREKKPSYTTCPKGIRELEKVELAFAKR